uniref:DSC E3 ubiquitin ligase complex subunit 3 C-terminal domain-containing protein n=1 Tax=Haptolina ericina TaxID=156174 RepID=A0A7S3AVR9_9EUKA|mmetsp:Transcript_34496/g.78194  ORF Transcript_34496/g.78194 Transcript_34496/m.78194 type:complete len:229 (+) Transcript_34496:32-718(+)
MQPDEERRITLVLHSPDAAVFDETLPACATVSDLVTRVRCRANVSSSHRIRLISSGALLEPSSTIGKAVRARDGVEVYHVHYAVQAPPQEPAHVAAPTASSSLLPQVTHGGRVTALDDDIAINAGGYEYMMMTRNRHADLVWGFTLGLILGVLTLFILTDRSLPRMMQTGILLGVSCNTLFSVPDSPSTVHMEMAHDTRVPGAANEVPESIDQLIAEHRAADRLAGSL